VEILRAGPGDAGALTGISFAAKRYWGYPERWMERWQESLTISPHFIRRNEVYAATFDQEIVVFYALVGEGREIDLEHLWVTPEHIGTGVGRALFEHAVRTAAALGAEVMRIEADPNAEGFYRRMGATRVGEISYLIDGQDRSLPLLVIDVQNRRRAGQGSELPDHGPGS
jgi:GNAT superfamily N-acetyltransferase